MASSAWASEKRFSTRYSDREAEMRAFLVGKPGGKLFENCLLFCRISLDHACVTGLNCQPFFHAGFRGEIECALQGC